MTLKSSPSWSTIFCSKKRFWGMGPRSQESQVDGSYRRKSPLKTSNRTSCFRRSRKGRRRIGTQPRSAESATSRQRTWRSSSFTKWV